MNRHTHFTCRLVSSNKQSLWKVNTRHHTGIGSWKRSQPVSLCQELELFVFGGNWQWIPKNSQTTCEERRNFHRQRIVRGEAQTKCSNKDQIWWNSKWRAHSAIWQNSHLCRREGRERFNWRYARGMLLQDFRKRREWQRIVEDWRSNWQEGSIPSIDPTYFRWIANYSVHVFQRHEMCPRHRRTVRIGGDAKLHCNAPGTSVQKSHSI